MTWPSKKATLAPFSWRQAVVRSGSQFSFIAVPASLGGDANSNFTALNVGRIKTSGLDFQLGYNLPTDFAVAGSSLNANLMVNYLIDYKVRELPGVTLDYAGSASVFGAGLGTSFPRWKGTANLAWNLKTQGRMHESRQLYEEASAGNHLQTLLGWARMEEADRNLDRALELLDRAEQVAPDAPSITLSRAVVHGRSRDYQRALALLDKLTTGKDGGKLGAEEWLEKGRLGTTDPRAAAD